jgi:hypothetical protein
MRRLSAGPGHLLGAEREAGGARGGPPGRGAGWGSGASRRALAAGEVRAGVKAVQSYGTGHAWLVQHTKAGSTREGLPLGREVALEFLSRGASEAGTPPMSRSEKGQRFKRGSGMVRLEGGGAMAAGPRDGGRRALTLAAGVHAPEHLPQLLGLGDSALTARHAVLHLDPTSRGELPAPLEDQQEGGVLLHLLLTRGAPGPALWLHAGRWLFICRAFISWCLALQCFLSVLTKS